MRKHQLVQAEVRCFLIRGNESFARKRESEVFFFDFATESLEALPMRLEHPDDDLGGTISLAFPVLVVHRIDSWSPLNPDSVEAPDNTKMDSYSWPRVLRRQIDAESGLRNMYSCSACGAEFPTRQILSRHLEYNQLLESKAPLSASCGLPHAGIKLDSLQV